MSGLVSIPNTWKQKQNINSENASYSISYKYVTSKKKYLTMVLTRQTVIVLVIMIAFPRSSVCPDLVNCIRKQVKRYIHQSSCGCLLNFTQGFSVLPYCRQEPWIQHLSSDQPTKSQPIDEGKEHRLLSIQHFPRKNM